MRISDWSSDVCSSDLGGMLAHAFRGTPTRFCVVSFDTDWLYPTRESRTIVQALNAAGAPASFVELSSPFGHDAFLLDSPEFRRIVDGFLRPRALALAPIPASPPHLPRRVPPVPRPARAAAGQTRQR